MHSFTWEIECFTEVTGKGEVSAKKKPTADKMLDFHFGVYAYKAKYPQDITKQKRCQSAVPEPPSTLPNIHSSDTFLITVETGLLHNRECKSHKARKDSKSKGSPALEAELSPGSSLPFAPVCSSPCPFSALLAYTEPDGVLWCTAQRCPEVLKSRQLGLFSVHTSLTQAVRI